MSKRSIKGNILLYATLLYIANSFFFCGSDTMEMWRIKWFLRGSQDSLNISIIPEYSIIVEHYLNSAIIENKYFQPDSSYLHAQISMSGSKSYVKEFPETAKLSVKIWYKDTTLLDTVFNWDELHFDNNNINYQTFYISSK